MLPPRSLLLALCLAPLVGCSTFAADADGPPATEPVSATADDATPTTTGAEGRRAALRCVVGLVAFEWALAQPHGFVVSPPSADTVADFEDSLHDLPALVPPGSDAEVAVVVDRLRAVADLWPGPGAAERTAALLEGDELRRAQAAIEERFVRHCR